MGRRQYGTGTVYQRKEDGRWIGRAEIGWTSQGTRRRVTVSGKTEAEAKRKLRDKLRTLSEAEDTAPGRKLTVKAWSEQWLPLHAARVRPRSHTSAASAVKVWILPTIGHAKLETLTPADVRKVEKAIRTAGRSDSTVVAADTTLRTMLKDARTEGHKIPDGVFTMARPGVADSERDAIPTPDALAILRAADGTPDFARWVMALMQGMRQAEVTGLTWEHVDLERGLVDVSWQLTFVAAGATIPSKYRSKHLAGHYHLIQPKTKAGDRVVPLAPPAWKALLAWRDVAPTNPWGLVFPAVDRRTGKGAPLVPRDPLRDRAAWYALQAKAGVQKGWKPPKKKGGEPEPDYWKLHEARHTTATLLISAGVEPSIVAAILGQASLVRAYVHLKAENLRPAIDTMSDLLDWKAETESSPAKAIEGHTI